jgi:sugar diacid utilization regulator
MWRKGAPSHDQTFASRLRAALKEAERHLAVPGGQVLVGMRHSEIVCLHPVGDYDDLHDLKEHCQELGLSLVPVGTKIGIGGWHPTLAGVTSSYAEAREAVTRALREDRDTRVIAFDAIVVDHLLRSSPSAHQLLGDTLARLRAYDLRGRSRLLATLRKYVEADTSLTRTARAMHVHPNTIVYRLGRIRDVTGRDPTDRDDLLVLALALKLDDLGPDPVERGSD